MSTPIPASSGSRAWGLEDKTTAQQIAAAINAGTDVLSGFNSKQTIVDVVNSGLVSRARIDEAVTAAPERAVRARPVREPVRRRDEGERHRRKPEDTAPRPGRADAVVDAAQERPTRRWRRRAAAAGTRAAVLPSAWKGRDLGGAANGRLPGTRTRDPAEPAGQMWRSSGAGGQRTTAPRCEGGTRCQSHRAGYRRTGRCTGAEIRASSIPAAG